MFAIGPSLREARMRRGLSSADVQKAIRIRERYLTALEEERWELLPGDAYVKGFLRTYAEYLGLDGNLYVDEYNSRHLRLGEPAFVPEAATTSSVSRIGVLRPLGAIAAIVAVVAAVAAWQLRGNGGAGPTGGGKGATEAAQTTQTHTRTHTTHRHATKPAAKPAVLPMRAVLAATNGPVWLFVRSGGPSGAVVYEGTLAAGQTLPVSIAQKVWLRVGAPWNLQIRVGGKAIGGLPAHPANLYLSGAGLQPAG